MINIRRSVFETNSSSTHSVTYKPGGLQPSTLEVDEDGYIHTHLGEFGWETCDYTDQETRLSYLVTMLAELLGHHCWCIDSTELNESINIISQSIEFKDLAEEICSYTSAKGLILDVGEGYIDHQSVEFSTMSDYLDDCGTDVLGFVFGDTTVHTGNDNDYPVSGFYSWLN